MNLKEIVAHFFYQSIIKIRDKIIPIVFLGSKILEEEKKTKKSPIK